METINTYDEAMEILHKPIVDKIESAEIAHDQPNAGWVGIGAMQQTRKEWEYGFRKKSNITVWSESLQIRRWPTGIELDSIYDNIRSKNNSVDK